MNLLKNTFSKLLLCLCLLAAFPGFCMGQDPLSELSLLIASTEDLLEQQKNLKTKLKEYILLHDTYLLDMDNRELLLKTARAAKTVLTIIKDEKLTPIFDSSFLSELTLFAKMAKNPSIPKIP